MQTTSFLNSNLYRSLCFLLIASTFHASCAQKKTADFPDIKSLYQAKAKPQAGDWLSTHDEKYIDIESYKNSHPTRADGLRKIIYIYKLGDNTRAEDSLLEITREYLELVFHLKTKAALTFPISCVTDSMKRDLGSEVQVSTHFILDTLVNLPIPEDAAVAICFTRYDLYPNEDWNFVFGQAYIHERAGIWSFNRYGDVNNPLQFGLALQRTLKVAAHETGHMFSIRHCVRYECNMNGSNSMGETDASPLHYCPDCLEKLAWNRQFDLESHFERLQSFYQKYGLKNEEDFMKKNLRKIK